MPLILATQEEIKRMEVKSVEAGVGRVGRENPTQPIKTGCIGACFSSQPTEKHKQEDGRPGSTEIRRRFHSKNT
jgi:hypothetical protein